MYAFAAGVAIALALTVGAILVFDTAEITMVERSSPAASVRVDDKASQSGEGAGYANSEERTREQHVKR